MSCLVADEIYFNSKWNLQSFIDKIPSFINRNPDKQPKQLVETILPKMKVLYFPIVMPLSQGIGIRPGSEAPLCTCSGSKVPLCTCSGSEGPLCTCSSSEAPLYTLPNSEPPLSTLPNSEPPLSTLPNPEAPLHILWNHRWEHDKDPATFFSVLLELHQQGIAFHLSVLGQSYEETPPIFEQIQTDLKDHLIHYGFVASKDDYYAVLNKTDVCVSTAIHEFYGVSVLEAALCGNYCICPNRLSYALIASVI